MTLPTWSRDLLIKTRTCCFKTSRDCSLTGTVWEKLYIYWFKHWIQLTVETKHFCIKKLSQVTGIKSLNLLRIATLKWKGKHKWKCDSNKNLANDGQQKHLVSSMESAFASKCNKEKEWEKCIKQIKFAMENCFVMGELWWISVALYVQPSSVVHTLRTSSPLKPMGQSKPNFMLSPHGSGEQSLFGGSGSHDQDGHYSHIW